MQLSLSRTRCTNVSCSITKKTPVMRAVPKTTRVNIVDIIKSKISDTTKDRVRVLELQGGSLATLGLLTGTIVQNITHQTFCEQFYNNIPFIFYLTFTITCVYAMPTMLDGGIPYTEKTEELKMGRLAMLVMALILIIEHIGV